MKHFSMTSLTARLRRFLSTRYVVLYCSLAVTLLAMLLTFANEIKPLRISMALGLSGDIIFIMLPLLWIRKRWWLCLIPAWTLALFFYANILNYRFWGDMLSFTAPAMIGNFGDILVNSIIGLTRPVDLVFLLSPSAFTLLYIVLKRRGITPPSRKVSVVSTAASVIIYVLAQINITMSVQRYNHVHGLPDDGLVSETSHRMFYEVSNRSYFFNSNGLVIYTIYNTANLISKFTADRTLSDSERAEVASFLSDIHNANVSQAHATDSVFATNRNKNLVVFIVESLNGTVLNSRVNGLEITPTLNRLATAHGSVCATNLVSIAKDGGSSDGQMIINTGLLPLIQGAAIMEFPDNSFLSLCSNLPGYEKVAVFADNGKVWNELPAFKAYGFDRILTNETVAQPLADQYMMKQAAELVKTMRQPFFLECVTVSMHTPFDIKGLQMPPEIEKSSLPLAEKHYLTLTHNFDKALGRFLNHLYATPSGRNTVVVITSDHSYDSTFGKTPSAQISYSSNHSTISTSYIPVVFIAANTNCTAHITRIGSQANIFPTILEIMNRTGEARHGYSGLDLSILNPALDGTIDHNANHHGNPSPDQLQSRQISTLILRGNYFSPLP